MSTRFEPKDQEEVVDGQGTEEVTEEAEKVSEEKPGAGELVD